MSSEYKSRRHKLLTDVINHGVLQASQLCLPHGPLQLRTLLPLVEAKWPLVVLWILVLIFSSSEGKFSSSRRISVLFFSLIEPSSEINLLWTNKCIGSGKCYVVIGLGSGSQDWDHLHLRHAGEG